jgi:outer membrane protein
MVVRNFGTVSLGAAIVASLLFAPFVANGQQTGGLPAPPAPIIAVIDFKRAVEESEAGKSIIRQINDRHRRIQKEIAADTTALEETKRELEQQRAVLAPEAFKQRWRDFQMRVQEYRQGIQREQKKLDLMLGQSILQVEARLAEILRAMAREIGSNLVIDAGPGRGNILFSDSQLVLTEQAKARLNEVLPDIKVVEPPLKQRSNRHTPRLQIPKVQ